MRGRTFGWNAGLLCVAQFILLPLPLALGAKARTVLSPPPISTSAPTTAHLLVANRAWEILVAPPSSGDLRATFRHASDLLGDGSVELAGIVVTAAMLRRLGETSASEDMVRASREIVRRPVKPLELAFFLDDVLYAGTRGARAHPVVVTAGRARRAGILIHPAEIFGKRRAREYGVVTTEINTDPPSEPVTLAPAADGAPLGAPWAARYPNPSGEKRLLAELDRARPQSDFGRRVRLLLQQLRAQGADIEIDSTVRPRERGYLMWGAFELSRTKTAEDVAGWVSELNRVNTDWGLHVPIVWAHPDGWEATVEAARRMADGYSVVFATRRGARFSEHYDGSAIDMTVVALPRQLHLRSPSGVAQIFDLSHPGETRDLSLSPSLVEWIEENFQLRKLRFDYPHWQDGQGPTKRR